LTPTEKRRDTYLRKYYGITLAQYNKLASSQQGRCYICQREQQNFKRNLSVDHCHVRGTVRGLLCPWCNRGLKYFRDDPDWLKRAAKHVQRDPLGARVPDKYLKGQPKKRKRKKNNAT